MRRLFDWVAAVIFSMVCILAVWTIGPIIETRYFPVYSKFTIDSAEELPNGNVLIRVSFTKFRDCVPIGYAWYSGDGINVRQLNIIVRRRAGDLGSPNRPVGKQTATPFELDATIEEVSNAVFAEVHSRCHPLWTTRSEVFP